VKDAGDDPDVTNGMEIFARISRRQDGEIVIDGGEGIGRITRAGFWGQVGEAAINPVPRKMIREAVVGIAEHGWNVTISVPGGEEIAKKTFNPQLGIEGGISIIGTTGIVKPMSDDALKQTIYLTIDAIYDDGAREILLLLGNYGERMAQELRTTPYEMFTPDRVSKPCQGVFEAPHVKVSNFIGDAILYAYHKGFTKITLLGHIGKLCKLAIGVFNTHSKVCDARMEAFIYYLALDSAPTELLSQVNACATSEEVVALLREGSYEHIFEAMRQGCITRIQRYVKDAQFTVDVVLYSMEYGLLGERPC
jgi:cobalt-precorrin-5B (C1)-methyltransferase